MKTKTHIPGAPGRDGKAEAHVSLETDIDLQGRAASERLTVGKRALTVADGAAQVRKWPLERLERFRIDPAVGSYFLQARIDGRWTDLLRFSGRTSAEAVDLVARLNEHGHKGRRRETERSRPEGEPTPPSANSDSGAKGARQRRMEQFKYLISLFSPYRVRVMLLLGLSLGAVAIEVAPPMLQRYLVDNVLEVNLPESAKGQLVLYLLAVVAALLLVRVASTLVAIWKGVLSSQVGTAMTADLRKELVNKLNELPLAFHDRSQAGMLMSQVAYDTETLHTLIYHLTSGFILQSMQLIGIGAMLFYLNAKLALITLMPIPLILAGSWYFTKYLQPRQHHYWEAVGKMASALMGMLTGIRVVKSFAQEDREIERFCRASANLRDSRLTVDVCTATFTALMGFVFALGTLVVWYIGGRDVLFAGMTLGSLMAFIAYLAMFYTPLTTITESTAWFANFFAISRRIHNLLEVPGEAAKSEGTAPLGQIHGRLEFKNVRFGYDKSQPVLEDISFAVMPGEMVGVTGRSGSGKSTLVSLIGRLYEADSGVITIDGVDLRHFDVRQLRRQIGVVPQEPFLFRGSVADNINYGNARATPEQIIMAAKRADAHEFIMQMPFAYETQLGEGGTGLSGGQRQRLSIARALVCDPPILILDEATAGVDAESEKAICDALRKGPGGRTTIVVAHRLSTLRDVDKLLVFDNGRLIEQGTPAELLAQDGHYASLARLQYNVRQFVPGVLRDAYAQVRYGGDADGLGFADAGQFAETYARIGRENAEAFAPADFQRDKYEIKWLDPARDAIEDGGQGMLRVTADGWAHDDAIAVCAFPASLSGEMISIRHRTSSGKEIELGMLRALGEWPKSARQAVERSLARRWLLIEIIEIRQIRTTGNLLTMTVKTGAGTVKLRLKKYPEGCQSFGKDGLLLADEEGKYYVVANRHKLPRSQQRLLTLYFG
jgi:ATP-binding cassette subfamily B protein